MSASVFDTIVIGGGAIGCAIAFELSKSGQNVAVLEKGTVASGASGVSAAMLEAQLDAHRGEPFLSLALASQELFEPLTRELEETTGMDIQHERCGILQIALTPSERDELRRRYEFQIGKGLPASWLEPREVEESLPQLEGRFLGALFHRKDGQVNASRFTGALAQAARRRGAKVLEGTEVTGFRLDGSRVTGMDTKTGAFGCGSLVIAAGPWSSLLGRMLGLAIPVEPVRGQLVIFETSPAVLPYPVFYGSRYLTPKRDGFLLAGTTTEKAGFDDQPTAEATQAIARDAQAVMPLLKSKPFRGATAGLRPHSPDELPIMGRAPGFDNVFIATGHYRNGILLAPVTARILVSLMQDRTPPLPINAFSAERFKTPAC